MSTNLHVVQDVDDDDFVDLLDSMTDFLPSTDLRPGSFREFSNNNSNKNSTFIPSMTGQPHPFHFSQLSQIPSSVDQINNINNGYNTSNGTFHDPFYMGGELGGSNRFSSSGSGGRLPSFGAFSSNSSTTNALRMSQLSGGKYDGYYNPTQSTGSNELGSSFGSNVFAMPHPSSMGSGYSSRGNSSMNSGSGVFNSVLFQQQQQQLQQLQQQLYYHQQLRNQQKHPGEPAAPQAKATGKPKSSKPAKAKRKYVKRNTNKNKLESAMTLNLSRAMSGDTPGSRTNSGDLNAKNNRTILKQNVSTSSSSPSRGNYSRDSQKSVDSYTR